jgi:hypothetical protein
VLSEIINKCGANSEAIKGCMSEVKERDGVLGRVSFFNQAMQVPIYIKNVVNGVVGVVEEIK